MIPLYGCVVAGVLGLAFGSFLNVCVSRWPNDESILKPRSHCRSCGRQLAWWENVPLVSWLALRGRCRTCHASIGWRYPLAELAVAVLWAVAVWRFLSAYPLPNFHDVTYALNLANTAASIIFFWILVALAVLDAENLWLPDRLILPGIGLGLVLGATRATLITFLQAGGGFAILKNMVGNAVAIWFLGAVVAAAVVLAIRFVFRLIRGQEGIGMGDVKLMAMLGGWLGIKPSLIAFGIGVITCALYALLMLAAPSVRADPKAWAKIRLPFGTFICLGGVVCAFWGVPIVVAYWR